MHEHGGDLQGKAVSTIARYGMLRGGERVLVSVSGDRTLSRSCTSSHT